MVMKRCFVYVMLLIASMFSIWSVSAQMQRTTNLGDVMLKFCNDQSVASGTKTSVSDIEPEQEWDICMFVSNGWPTNTTVSLNFVDGTITSDEDQKKACEPETTKQNFGQYITNYPTSVQIAAWETVKIWAKVKFPAWYAGTAYGCATLQIVETGSTAPKESKMFTILTRRASFIDFNVKGEYIVDLQSQDPSMEWSYPSFANEQVTVVDSLLTPWHNISEVIASKNPLDLSIGEHLITRSVLVNSGNIWLDIEVHSSYSTWRWLYHSDQWTQHQKLVPKQRKTIEFNVDRAAWWLGGPVTATHVITYKPIVIGSGSIEPSLLAPQSMTLVGSGFIVSLNAWIMIWCSLIVLIVIMVLLFGCRHSSHHRSKSKSFT